MKKRFSSFAAGAATATMILGLCGTALAANGNVSFSFANIALDGQVKYTSGSTVTAPNGQQVPSSILYTDAAGGKTNYLPIRAVTELLGTDIGYDSASRTVLLGQQPAKTDGTVTKTSAGKWTRELGDVEAVYRGSGPETAEGEFPSCTPAWLPEGFGFTQLRDALFSQNGSAATRALYKNEAENATLYIDCFKPVDAEFSTGVKAVPAEALQEVAVQGYRADLYSGDDIHSVVWEDENGMLFAVEGINVSRDAVLRVAESLTPDASQGASYQLGDLPEGYSLPRRSYLVSVPSKGSQRWQLDGGYTTLYFSYTAGNDMEIPDGWVETVAVAGVQGRYYPDAATIEKIGEKDEVHNGIPVSTSYSGLVSRPSVIWTNAQGVTFQLQGDFSKEDLIRMAESVSAVG